MTARVVSRGSPSSKASDFGALEVFAQAAIGHTDPFKLAPVLWDQASRCIEELQQPAKAQDKH